jgi:hypothetical protein
MMSEMNRKIDAVLKKHGVVEEAREIISTMNWPVLVRKYDKIALKGRKSTVTSVDTEKKSVTFVYKDIYALEKPKGNRRERRAAKARAR